MPPLEYPSVTILLSLLIGFSITGIIYRTVYMREWIKDYCSTLHSALPKPDPVPILGTPENRFIEFTWDKSLWYRKEIDRMVIITAAALDAFNDYYDLFDLKDKALLYVSTKAIKKMSFHHGPMSTCCSSPQWGVEIAITYTDKPVQVKKEMYNFGEVPKQVKKSSEEKSIPIPKRQIVVCRNV